MTAEIAILNKQGIALAADSAVTLGKGEKIFSSANKIFTLSKYEPVGVMIYGNAEFLQVPWEVVIKAYRTQLGTRAFATVEEYADDFLSFLASEKRLFPEEIVQEQITSLAAGYFQLIKRGIIDELKKVLASGGTVSDSESRKLASSVIEKHFRVWKQGRALTGAGAPFEASLLLKHRDMFVKARSLIFQRLPLTPRAKEKLIDIAVWVVSRRVESMLPPNRSGLVIAGFGTEQFYPSLISYHIYGVAEGVLNYDKHDEEHIGTTSLSAVIPFAQSEMVRTFMEGIDPDFHSAMSGQLEELLIAYGDAIADNIPGMASHSIPPLKTRLRELALQLLSGYQRELDQFRGENYIDPVVDIVGSLPKDELAGMAESLVNLTSFKRRVSRQAETVGGPIDVAVISKGDGFIWIRRKHYFKPDLNPNFFANYFRAL